MSFTGIIGQTDILRVLKNSILQNRVGHASIFNGPEGIGKKTVARLYAKALLCSGNSSGDSCGTCMSCTMFAAGSNPDYTEIAPQGASISIDEIRRLQSDIVIRPVYSKRKVYVIIDAHKMTVQAQNCLLKVLEEPPAYAVLILTVSNYDAIIETIRSRAVRYRFRKNTPVEISSFLRQRFGNAAGIDFAASYADGVIGSAIRMMESGSFVELRDRVLELVLEMDRKSLGDVFAMYPFFEQNKDSIDSILDIMLMLYRDMLTALETGDEKILINSDKKDIILNNVSRFRASQLVKNIEAVEYTRKILKQNAGFQLAVEVMLMKLQEEKV